VRKNIIFKKEVIEMANVKMVQEEEAQGKTKQVYEDIKRTFGVLPNFFKVMGEQFRAP
jgi:hypothetical protein